MLFSVLVRRGGMTETVLTTARDELPASVRYLMQVESVNSRSTIVSRLNRVAGIFGFSDHVEFPWPKLTSDELYLAREKLKTFWAPTTVNAALSEIKAVCEIAFLHDQMDVQTYQRIKLVKRLKASRQYSGRELSGAEIKRFELSCDDGSYVGLRDKSIFLLGVGCGLRRAELASLTVSNLNFSDNSVNVIGKGDKERTVWMPDQVSAALDEYIHEVRVPEDSPLFVKFGKEDEPLIARKKHLGNSSINYILEQRRELAKIDKFKPHDLRKTYGTKLLRDGVDIKTVSRLLGHSSVTTTEIYDVRDEVMAKQASLSHRLY